MCSSLAPRAIAAAPGRSPGRGRVPDPRPARGALFQHRRPLRARRARGEAQRVVARPPRARPRGAHQRPAPSRGRVVAVRVRPVLRVHPRRAVRAVQAHRRSRRVVVEKVHAPEAAHGGGQRRHRAVCRIKRLIISSRGARFAPLAGRPLRGRRCGVSRAGCVFARANTRGREDASEDDPSDVHVRARYCLGSGSPA